LYAEVAGDGSGGNAATTPGAGGFGGNGQLAGGGGGGGGGVYGGGGGGGGTGRQEMISGNPFYYGPGGGGGAGGASTLPPGPPGTTSLSMLPTAPNAQPHITFMWAVPPPSVTTGDAVLITSSTARLRGTVNPNGSPVSDCHFSVAPAPAGGATVPCAEDTGSGNVDVRVTARVQGLKPSTTYLFQLTARTGEGESTGTPVQFKTAAAPRSAGEPKITGLVVPSKLHKHPRGRARPPAGSDSAPTA
jgi:hypothetical protein